VTVLFSDDQPSLDWSEARRSAEEFGVKGASALALPRKWTLPFAVFSVDLIKEMSPSRRLSQLISDPDLTRIHALAADGSRLIVRSSVVGESIWERGTYLSVDIAVDGAAFADDINDAAHRVVESAKGKPCGLLVQKFVSPASQGEFGNLQRISKTRDQWEISATDRSGGVTNLRLNSQRDAAADPEQPILARSGISQERLFGSVAAWLNNELLRGKSQRVTCEWVTDNKHVKRRAIGTPYRRRIGTPLQCPDQRRGA
jgi:hypothetical protein